MGKKKGGDCKGSSPLGQHTSKGTENWFFGKKRRTMGGRNDYNDTQEGREMTVRERKNQGPREMT